MFDEKEIVQKILKGDMKSFELLVSQYERLVFTVIQRLVANEEDRQDICQEVFVKVHKGLKGFAFQSRLSTWIGRIAYLTAINYLKAHKKLDVTQSVDDLANFHFSEEGPEQLAIRKDVSAYINKLIGQMPGQYKTVLTLYHLNDCSYQEIEEITGMPEGTVKSYLFRARKELKEQVSKYLKKELL